MIRRLAATAIGVLVLGTLVPGSAASAADATLTGVLSGSTGPQAGLVIGWVEAYDFSNVETATSGADGGYSLDIPDDIGDFYLFTNFVPNADGGGVALDADYTGEFFGASGERDFLRQGVTPYSLAPAGPLDITLTPSGSIEGAIPDYAGGFVTLNTLGGTKVATAQVPENGSFAFSGLVPGSYRVAAALADTNAGSQSSVVVVRPGETSDATVAPVAATISGVVKNGDKVLPNIRVEVYESIFTAFPIDEVDYPVATDTTDAKGRFTLPQLNPGDYTVVFRSYARDAAKSYVDELWEVRSLEARENRVVLNRLASAGTVTGKVTLEEGIRLYRARVYSASRHLVASTYGESSEERFVAFGIPAGKYTVYFSDTRGKYYGSKVVTVKAKQATSVGRQTLTKRTATLSGTVPGATGGFVVARWGDSEKTETTTISGNGSYALRGLFPGTYSVESRAAGATRVTQKITVTVGMGKKVVKKGKPFGTFSGTAFVDGVTVRDGEGAYTDADGGFRFFTARADGSFSAAGWPGRATLEHFDYANEPLPARSPYWYAVPDYIESIILTSGAATALGSFEFELHGRGDQ